MATDYNSDGSSPIADPYEMNILRKESFNRWYKIRTYFVASMLTSLPVQVSAVQATTTGVLLLPS